MYVSSGWKKPTSGAHASEEWLLPWRIPGLSTGAVPTRPKPQGRRVMSCNLWSQFAPQYVDTRSTGARVPCGHPVSRAHAVLLVHGVPVTLPS